MKLIAGNVAPRVIAESLPDISLRSIYDLKKRMKKA